MKFKDDENRDLDKSRIELGWNGNEIKHDEKGLWTKLN